VGASEVEYVASYRDVASLSASGPERNHRCEEAFERVVLTLDPEPLAWGGRYRAPGGCGGGDQHGRHVRRPSRTADLLAFATASATPPATRSHWQALRLVPAWAAQVPFSMNALASTAASASAPLVGPKVEMAAHNGNNASATRAFKFNLRVDWETQARNAIPSKFQFNTIQCNYN
jgi:hypothetical protein